MTHTTSPVRSVLLLAIVMMATNLWGAEQTGENRCSTKPTTNIYFSNGVGNSLVNAYASKNELKLAYANKLGKDYEKEKFRFVVAYNYSSQLKKDLLQVFIQKIEEEGEDNARLTAEEYLELIENGKKTKIKDDALAQKLHDLYLATLEQKYYQIGTVENHIQKYRSDLLEGKRVIVVAHSQGNLFANEAVDTLLKAKPAYAKNIGIVGVATPASRVINGAFYVTADDDRVINTLRRVSTVLPANIDNDPGIFGDNRDLQNHSFYESYFEKSLKSRAKIDTAFMALVTSLQYPESELGDGALVVTLEWGAQPDVDLHVYEPGGKHVYYSQTAGDSGFLDLDDTTSFGPEHYYASCAAIALGTYRIAVNYYSGEGAETARVQVSTVDGRTVTRRKPLAAPVGSEGDESPLTVMKVIVSENKDGLLLFSYD